MLHVGAAVTQATLEWRPGLAQELPLLALAFPHISHFQIRNRGTVAGSIAHADPFGRAAAGACWLLGGEVCCAARGAPPGGGARTSSPACC
jgi:2-furoyl-CoA dehydrogenase FAD binding subunit